MPTVLTVAGTAFELVGLALVFYELAVIRSHELGIAPPWASTTARVRRTLGRPEPEPRTSAPLRRPEHVPSPIRIADQEQWGRGGPELVDRAIHESREAALRQAAQQDQAITDAIAHREAEQRKRLRPSIRRQAIGATCVLFGVVLGALGNLI